MISVLFKEAVSKMIADGELEKLLNHATKAEKRNLEKDIEMFKKVSENTSVENIPFIALLNSISSADLLKNTICYMQMLEKKYYEFRK